MTQGLIDTTGARYQVFDLTTDAIVYAGPDGFTARRIADRLNNCDGDAFEPAPWRIWDNDKQELLA